MKDDRETPLKIDIQTFLFLREMRRLDLEDSLRQRNALKQYKLGNGKTLELRNGERQDIINICYMDNATFGDIYKIGDEDILRVTSFSDSPLEPVGFYVVRNFPDYKSIADIFDNSCSKPMVGEGFVLYVSKNYRRQKLGSILTAISALDIINDPDNDFLKFKAEPENTTSNHILQKLGITPKGKDWEGYNIYMVSLGDGQRNSLKNMFQSSLDHFLADSKIDASNNLPYQAGLSSLCYSDINKASQSQFCCAP